ncbi:hypothetical protein PAL_GLEAN10008686 [Pteropus alecto]|uniref:Uncharacterized protein n=1 Tax=Pteropus alecto TaxID=9402 RepID=L5KTF1_PTEAL|nr:hypothetical protein PAL_GLEAN10008686 [Pteropus alecto]
MQHSDSRLRGFSAVALCDLNVVVEWFPPSDSPRPFCLPHSDGIPAESPAADGTAAAPGLDSAYPRLVRCLGTQVSPASSVSMPPTPLAYASGPCFNA